MRITTFMIAFFLLATPIITAQNKSITIADIWKPNVNTFRTERLQALHSMANGKEYAVQNFDNNTRVASVDIYNYESGEKVRTAVSTAEIEGLDYFIAYEFSADEQKVLLSTQIKSIFRRSTLGEYYVYDLLSRKLTKVSDDLIQEPTFSPDGTKIAYGKNNNLYVFDIDRNETNQFTFDGKKNSIINGITDWVYEEEFGFVRAFDWSADGKRIAYIRFDETNVPEFSMDVYGDKLYQTQTVFKYPKAGEENAKVSLHVYSLGEALTGTNVVQTKQISFGNIDPYYIPRIAWSKDPNILSIQTLNRNQNDLVLVFYNASTNKVSQPLRDRDQAYVDVTDNLTFLEDNSFIWTSEKDGWNHIYHYNKDGSLKKQVTSGKWEVTEYYGYDAASNRIFYQSTENGSINRGIYAIDISGKNKTPLAVDAGSNNADFSADFTYFINTFSDTTTPWRYTLHNAKDGKLIKTLKDNETLKTLYNSYKVSPKEFFTLPINGEDLNGYMIKPLDFDPTKKYPLFMYQYSGPGSQSVKNSWNSSNDMWFQMLAQEGYIVVCIDPRGTGLKGRDFKKITQKELGKYEVIDQIAAAEKLGKREYIDADRIGIFGWSYGGFMASNCLFQGADTFKMAIAVAPVTSWRFYDTIYTERYMLTPQVNPGGYDRNSPLSHVEKLKGDLLLVHGSADDNVHVQNSTRLVEALVQANKQFTYFNYPDKNHGIYGGNTRYHLYTMMTNYIKEKL
ncbi:peptidase S9 [Dokdonia pacifica]|uniref:Dipeptidyl-peptidase-4 n=1 Tax=Dokdonia pacifica TaxID=1627892 RepID=A0A239DMT3_9FLAO|nr:S9 family peptidase [Dokdonia pacifica]GGG37068.1 peptidase S9 [Dokdonia pacifica]SNS33459.1 dipeptidyl-peptidase-4 [Dokdonia pacifica]